MRVYVFLCLFAAFNTCTSASASSCLAFDAGLVSDYERDWVELAAVVHSTCDLQKVTLTVSAAGWRATEPIGQLKGRTSAAVRLTNPSPVDAAIVLVSGKSRFGPITRVKVISATGSPPASSAQTATYVVAALGFAATLFATLIAGWMTERRERLTIERKRSADSFEQDKIAYREFLEEWGGGHNSRTLRSALERLRIRAPLPSIVERTAETLIDQLESAGSRESVSTAELREMILRLQSGLKPDGLAGKR